MSPNKVLIAIDDEASAEKVVSYVLAQSWPEGARFMMLHVVEPFPVPHLPPSAAEVRDQCLDYGWKLVTDFAAKLKNAFPESIVERNVVEGYAKHQIVELAESWEADLIVIGSLGRHSQGKFLLGSVVQAVSEHAPCAVTIVRLVGSRKAEAMAKSAAGQAEA